jgi:hypothetical protein
MSSHGSLWQKQGRGPIRKEQRETLAIRRQEDIWKAGGNSSVAFLPYMHMVLPRAGI